MHELGKIVKRERLRRGMRGMDLAYAIGKDPGYVTRLERGTLKEIPPPEIVKALSEAIGVSESDIIEAIGYTRPEPIHTVNEDRPSYAADAFIASLSPDQRALLRRLLDEADRPRPGDEEPTAETRRRHGT